jgi:hypothetical protein
MRSLCTANDDVAKEGSDGDSDSIFSAFVLPPIPSSSLRLEFLGSPMPSKAQVQGTTPVPADPEQMDSNDSEGAVGFLLPVNM